MSSETAEKLYVIEQMKSLFGPHLPANPTVIEKVWDEPPHTQIKHELRPKLNLTAEQ